MDFNETKKESRLKKWFFKDWRNDFLRTAGNTRDRKKHRNKGRITNTKYKNERIQDFRTKWMYHLDRTDHICILSAERMKTTGVPKEKMESPATL